MQTGGFFLLEDLENNNIFCFSIFSRNSAIVFSTRFCSKIASSTVGISCCRFHSSYSCASNISSNCFSLFLVESAEMFFLLQYRVFPIVVFLHQSCCPNLLFSIPTARFVGGKRRSGDSSWNIVVGRLHCERIVLVPLYFANARSGANTQPSSIFSNISMQKISHIQKPNSLATHHIAFSHSVSFRSLGLAMIPAILLVFAWAYHAM